MKKMTDKFFTLSEQLMKFRRNLLAISVIGIIHVYFNEQGTYTPRIFDVEIPTQFLEIALPLAVLWFATNYFYHLYAELTQWKADNIPLELENIGNKTISAALAIATGGRLYVNIELQNGFTTVGTPADYTPDSIMATANENMNAWMKASAELINERIKGDLERIEAFNKAVRRYNWANQTRLYVMDISIPALMALTATVPQIGKFLLNINACI